MAAIEVEVKRHCIVAWQCPKCGQAVATQTYRRTSRYQELKPSERSQAVQEKLIHELSASMPSGCQDYSKLFRYLQKTDFLSQKDSAAFLLGLHFDSVRCPICRCKPAWSISRSHGINVLLAFLCIVLSFVLISLLFIVFKPFLSKMPLAIPLLMFCSVSIIVCGVVGSMKIHSQILNRNSHSPTIPEHMPLVAYDRHVDENSNDPRIAALQNYLSSHPSFMGGFSVNSHTFIDAD